MQQFIVDVEMQLVVDSEDDAEHLAENIYARCAELAYSDDHLLELSVFPRPLPPVSTSGPLDSGNTPAPQA